MEETKPTIMVVEDDPLLSGLLLRKLEQKFGLLYAPNGEEALETLKTHKPDLLLLDIVLPGIDGFEVLRQIKSNPLTTAIPVIILSNLGRDSDFEQGKTLGAEKFVVKVTLTPDEIVHLVQTQIESQKTKAA